LIVPSPPATAIRAAPAASASRATCAAISGPGVAISRTSPCARSSSAARSIKPGFRRIFPATGLYTRHVRPVEENAGFVSIT